jgi:hypothetical protein
MGSGCINRQKVKSQQKSTVNAVDQILRYCAGKLRHGAGTRGGCAIAQESCAMAQGPDGKIVFTRFEPKITFLHPKSLI